MPTRARTSVFAFTRLPARAQSELSPRALPGPHGAHSSLVAPELTDAICATFSPPRVYVRPQPTTPGQPAQTAPCVGLESCRIVLPWRITLSPCLQAPRTIVIFKTVVLGGDAAEVAVLCASVRPVQCGASAFFLSVPSNSGFKH